MEVGTVVGIQKIKGQVALESSLALIATIVFLMCAFRIFLWFSQCLVQRHYRYEATRPTWKEEVGIDNLPIGMPFSFYKTPRAHEAASNSRIESGNVIDINFYRPPTLDIWQKPDEEES